MFGIILIIIIVFVYRKHRQQTLREFEEKLINNDGDDITFQLLSYVERMKSHQNEIGVNIISIHSFIFLNNGEPSMASGFLSVCMRGYNDGFMNIRAAENIGAEICQFKGTTYAQIPVKKMIKSKEKKIYLKFLKKKLEQRYERDLIEYDEKIPAIYIMSNIW